MKKIFLVLLICTFFCAGCNKNDDASDITINPQKATAAPESTTTLEPTATPKPTDTPTPTPRVDDDEDESTPTPTPTPAPDGNT